MSTTQGAGKPVSADAELELLSAWLDGELEPGQYNVILDRLKTDPALRAQFEWFNLAGDALRSHEVAACDDPALVGQVRRALQAEPVRIGPGAISGSKLRRHIATGVTVAAAAGMLAVVALPQLRGPGGAQVTPVTAPMVTNTIPAPGPALAQAPATKPKAARSSQLDRYFQAHGGLAATGVMPEAAGYIKMAGEQER
jgi:negative regulator of sigma E activity